MLVYHPVQWWILRLRDTALRDQILRHGDNRYFLRECTNLQSALAFAYSPGLCQSRPPRNWGNLYSTWGDPAIANAAMQDGNEPIFVSSARLREIKASYLHQDKVDKFFP